ncbi:hypothetical protein ACIGHN_27060 [Acidovorax sp. NPDC077693]|uniref:hypothetical protein n=1 Tax=unclassified Acidovorax TaxID=2684926 RepID=UPI0037C87C2E
MIKFLIVFSIFLPSYTLAQERINASKLDAPQFTLGYVGFVGHISEAELYMKSFSKSPNAAKSFAEVIDDSTSTSVAKLYALCGFKKAGGTEIDVYARKLREKGVMVSTMHGDQMKKEAIGFFVDRIIHQTCDK